MLQMSTEATVVHKDFECRLDIRTFRVHCGGAQVSVQH